MDARGERGTQPKRMGRFMDKAKEASHSLKECLSYLRNVGGKESSVVGDT